MGTETGTIATDVQGVSDTGVLSTDDAANAFLSRWLDDPEKVPSKGDEEGADGSSNTETEEEADEDESDATTEDDTEHSEDGEESEDETEASEEDGADEDDAPEGQAKPTPDDAEVEITVGDEKHKVKVADLKRLYGQEAALTKKSQEIATIRKDTEAHSEKVAATLDRLMKAAEERYKPYAEIDMLLAAKSMDEESFKQLREDAKSAYADLQFINTEVNTFITNAQAQRKADMQRAAEEAVKVLKNDIPDWSDALYNEIRMFAISKGMPAEVINNTVDANAIKLINMARMYEKGLKTQQAAADKVKRKVSAPKKVIKTTTPAKAADAKNAKRAQAMTTLKQSGRIDDAANAFLSGWMDD